MIFHKSFVLAVSCCALFSSLEAKPTGWQLKSGTAQFREGENGAFFLETGAKTQIDWESFSIGLKELVHFQQADPKSYVLNCVKGSQESQILGKLTSNGAVYLVNPQGIFIGKEAHIQTAGFIASTLDLLDRDLSGLYFCGESEKGIVNWGKIECPIGDVFLIGRSVENGGSVEAVREGLLAGCEVWIQGEKAPQVHIRAEEMEPKLLEEHPYAVAIRHTGDSKAREVYLKSDTICEARGNITGIEGGKIHILGEEVKVLEGALFDVSGEKGGGEILIGGDYQGKNPDIFNAKRTFVGQDVKMKADAFWNGPGGKVIVWGDEATIYYGSISAQGGIEGGDGGFVEVSGECLTFDGLVSTQAPQGKVGVLLLDPTDITISTGGDSGGSFGGCVMGTNTFTASGNSNTINTTTLQDLLNACSVTISTVSGGMGTGSITISNAVTWSAATTLTLTAEAYIDVNAAVTNTSATTGFTAMNFTASGVGATTNAGIDVGANLQTTGGDIILTGTGANVSDGNRGVLLQGGALVTSTGNATITGTVGGSSVSTVPVYGVGLQTTNWFTSSSGSISISGNANGATGLNSYGVGSISACTTGTTGTLTYFNCTGGAGTTGHGVFISGALTTSGNIVATSNIQGGTGTGSVGFFINNNMRTLGLTSSIQITASSLATLGACHGVASIGTANATVGGSIILRGTSGASTNTAAFGVSLIGSITSSSGQMFISGTSTAVVTGSHGVSITGWSPATTGTVTFSDCVGGNVGASHGINVAGSFSAVGDVVATSNIKGGTGAGSIGLNVGANFRTTSGSLQATASSQGTSGACHGISISVGSVSATTVLTVSGTSGPSTDTASFGIRCSSSGTAAISGASVNTISGRSVSQAAGSHGIAILTNWTATATNGTTTFVDCIGGSGAASHGIHVAAAFATTGNLVATSNIQGGTGAGSFGLNIAASGATFRSSGTSTTVQVTASSNATSGACHGIAVTNGAITTLAGTITLIGTSGVSADTPSYGIYMTSATSAVSSSNGGSMTLSGTSRSTMAGSHGIVIETNALNGGSSGTLTLSGTAGSTMNASYAVYIGPGASVRNSAGTLQLNGGSGLYGNYLGGDVITAGGAITLSSTTLLDTTGAPHIRLIDATNGGATAAGANISLNGTVDGATTRVQNLNLRAGTSGAVRFAGAIGANVPVGAITIVSAKTTASAINLGTSIVAASWSSTTVSPVTLTANSSIDTSGATGGNIPFNSTIDGLTHGAASLTLRTDSAGSVSFAGNVGGTTQIGALTIQSGTGGLTIGTAVTAIQANSFTVASAIPTTLQNTGTLTINTSVFSGGSISFGGTVQETSAGAQALTLTANASGSVTFLANVGSTRLGALTISEGASQLSIGANVTSIKANSFTVGGTVPTVLSNTMPLTIATSTNIAFGGTVNGSQALTLTPTSGSVTFSGAVGNSTALGAITISAATNVTASSSIRAASLTQLAGTTLSLFSGALTITGDISLTGNQFTLNGVVVADDVTITNAGLLTLGSGADMALSGAFSQLGVGLVQTGADITTVDASISWNSGVTLTSDVFLEAGTPGTVTFTSSVNGGYGLTLRADEITFGSSVGAAEALLSLQVTAVDAINLHGDQTVSTGPMIYEGEVFLNSATTLTDSGANGMQFLLPLSGASIQGNYALILRATNSSIAVDGDIDLSGTSGSAGGDFTVEANTSASFEGQILTQGGDASPGTGGAGGAVSISCVSGSVSVHNINASGGSGTVAGGNAGDITLSAAQGYSGGYPRGTIILNRDLSSGHDGNLVAMAGSGIGGGTVTLSSNRSTFSTVATITSSSAGNDLFVRSHTFEMGLYEAMTILGNLELVCTTVTLGDVVALRDLALLSVTTNLNTRGTIELLSSTGSFYDSPSLHFTSGGNHINTGALIPSTGPLSAQSLELSPSAFRPLLSYDGHILNYDADGQSIPSSTSFIFPERMRQFAIYQLLIADAQLSDLLPIYKMGCNATKMRCPNF